MKGDTIADSEDVVCGVNCLVEDHRQKLFYNRIKALGRH